MWWVVLSFDLSHATSTEPQNLKFGTWDSVVRDSVVQDLEFGTLHVGVGTSDFQMTIVNNKS
jgi:hypothetical protein